MKVIAVNGSPSMKKGNTALILDPFLKGMEDAGAEVETIYTKKLKINPCLGDLCCWLKTPGQCIQKDDMQMLYPKFKETDVWVFASPVYVDGMVGPMKNLIDRLIPLLLPFFNLSSGHCRHFVPKGHKYGKVVLVSNSGFWEMDNFDPLVVHIEAMCKNMSKEYAGALLRPHGEAMGPLMEMGESLDDIFESAREAGRQLISQGAMSEETLKTISRELLPLETYAESINSNFKRVLEKFGHTDEEDESWPI